MKRICVFCGASMGNRPAYRTAAETLGRALAERGIGLVYGGGKVGLMGALADACLAAGGEVIGVIPQGLVERELAHPGAREMRIVGSLHERKALMADLSDAFITLPGGMGTWEEVCEVLSWAQLGLHRKPCGLINVDGFYNSLIAMFDHAVAEGFLAPRSRALVLEEHDPLRLLDRLETTLTPYIDRWIRPPNR
jgi:hypothetical protein